ncbi:Hypothetical predicted protein [Olea europaea subsp. europaea]|uniref:Uncharacterized protein n=1 Tax=Olea europaea subsp. europaea TaxID=158383 RepID=A0A8S0VNB7_OLEEU|nr:Hypothetical predicted protein [Olea europaea subsp. europaea]
MVDGEVQCIYVGKRSERVEQGWWVAAKVVPLVEMEEKTKKDEVEKIMAAYWTALAPNVEDHSGSLARTIVAGSELVVNRILWCGDVTVDRLI